MARLLKFFIASKIPHFIIYIVLAQSRGFLENTRLFSFSLIIGPDWLEFYGGESGPMKWERLTFRGRFNSTDWPKVKPIHKNRETPNDGMTTLAKYYENRPLKPHSRGYKPSSLNYIYQDHLGKSPDQFKNLINSLELLERHSFWT